MSARDQFAVWMAGGDSVDPPAPSSDTDKLAEVTADLAALKQANALRDLRAKVSQDTGVPASLLTGDTEAACRAQAAAIAAYAESVSMESPAYPNIRDGGEIAVPKSEMAQFEEWMDSTIGRLPPARF